MAVTAAAAAALLSQGVTATLFPKNSIGSVTIDVLIEVQHVDTLEATENPVEQGALITDHSFMRPFEVTLRCGWSNSSLNSLLGIAAAAFSFGSQPTISDYVTSVYTQLQSLQQSRAVLDIVTPLRTYQDMLIRELSVTRDQTTSQALMVTAVCRQAIIVTTQTSTLPPQANQATPQATAETTNSGNLSPVATTPATGGSTPYSEWTSTLP